MSTRALLNSDSCYLLFPPLPTYPTNVVSTGKKKLFTSKEKVIRSKKDLCEYLKGFLDKILLSYSLIELIINKYCFKETYCSNVDNCGNDNIITEYIYYGWGYKRIASYDDCGILIRGCSIKCLKQCLKKSIKQLEWFTNGDKLENGFKQSGNIKYNQDLLDKKYVFDINNWVQKMYSTRLYNCDMDEYWINFWKFNLEIEFDSYQYVVENGTNKLCVQFN
eukprot:267610_1